MDNNLILTIAVTSIAIGVGYFLYTKTMGCTNSVHAEKSDEKNKNNTNNDPSSAAATTSNAKARAKSNESKYPGGKVHIYFGSQTGTAEGYARTIMEEGKEAGFDTKVIDLEEFDAEQLAVAHLAIFLVATYGEGSPTDNAARFAQWLKNEDKELAGDFLGKLQYTVFGLGNRQYEHYNRMGKVTDQLLETLCAKRVFEYGEGDDDGTLEEDFDAWKSKLWPALTSQFIHGSSNSEHSNNSMTATSHHHTAHKVNLEFQVIPVELEQKKIDELRAALVASATASAQVSSKQSLRTTNNNSNNFAKINASTRHFFTAPRAKILVNRELRNQAFNVPDSNDLDGVGSTRHVEIDLSTVNLPYFTADNLAILPENNPKKVQNLLNHLGYDARQVIDIKPLDSEESIEAFKVNYPTPCSIEELFTMYVDITGELRHSTLKSLVAYVEDSKQKAWLEELVADSNRAKYKQYAEEKKPSISDLLEDELSSLKIPLQDLLHILPAIQPRYYTISSSSSVHPQVVHITISLTEYHLKQHQRQFSGLCSSYVKHLIAGRDAARVFIRPSTFRLPKSLQEPVIMIGPGTGIAPMRALLQEREYLLSQKRDSSVSSSDVGPFELYFGCKHEEMDYIYRDELEAYKAQGILSGLNTAFSRDQAKKIYVQNLLSEESHARQLADWLLNHSAHVYVCGATAMGHDVLNAFQQLLERYGKLSKEEATKKIKTMQDQGLYVQELWTA